MVHGLNLSYRIGIWSALRELTDARERNLRIAESQISVSYDGDISAFNPVRHLTAVVYSIIRYSVEKRPFLIGLPGLIALGVG